MSLLDDIRRRRDEKYQTLTQRGFTIPTWDELVAVFEPIKSLAEVERIDNLPNLLDVAVARLTTMCVRIDQLDADGNRVPLLADDVPVRLDHTLGRLLEAPEGVLGSAKDLLVWLVGGREPAVAEWSLQVYLWSTAQSREVDEQLVGESQAGPASTLSPASAV